MVVKRIVQAGLVLEGCVLLCYLIGGARGVRASYRIQEQNLILAEQLKELQQEIDQVQSELNDWQRYPWYRENYARKELQMARPGEEIYLV